MGANSFMVHAQGKTASEAFKTAVEEARYKHGNGGYTGTIAEKRDFVLITLPPGQDAREAAGKMLDECDRRIDDKWGPAGCFRISDGNWLFFGYASS